jgi:serine/threonine protein kinase
VSSSPSPTKGTLLHRLCPSCDVDVHEDVTSCPKCGSKLVEVRDEVDNTVGTVIDDRFEVRGKIGQGGMGTVYRAWQKSIGREVAIKLMDRSYSRDTMAVRRFFREARLASQLSQPNTVSVFDFGQAADGRLFIAMELIRGRTLHEVVQTEGAFSIARCVHIGTQICDALEAAHAIGIVHRDLKLENVILLDHPSGRSLIKVLDFGLAKNIRDDPGSRATESGIVVGTPRYMSPEAATLGTTGPAGDLYSLGVILGELAVGKPMWSGETLTELIAQKMDPSAAVARTPVQLRPLLARLLDPDPDRRPTAEQARALLANATNEPGAGDTVLDSEPGAGATTNLRNPSPALGSATRQLTPSKLALAPTGAQLVTPRPQRPDTARPEASLSASEAGALVAASPSLADLERPPARRWPLAIIGVGALGAIIVTIVLATRSDDAPRSPARAASAPADAGVALDAAAAPAVAPPVVDERPAMVTIRVTSEPKGATVTYGNETKVTPFEIVVERGTQPITFAAKHPGRTPATIQVVPSEDRTAAFKLQRMKRVNKDEDTPF